MAISATSYSKTPQAFNDVQRFADYATDDVGVTYRWNVLANDLGGNGKKLYSVGVDSAWKTLSKADAVGNWENTVSGNQVRITADGQVEFRLVTTAAAAHTQAGYQDSFYYAIQLGDGTLSWAKATFTLGSNMAATFGGTSTAALTEDSGIVLAGGQLTVSDVDYLQGSFSAATSSLTGTYGAFTFDASTGAWTYAMDNGKAQVLGDSTASATDTLTVQSLDGTTKTIAVTITGVNDAASFSGDTGAALTESNAAQEAGGAVVVTDVDSATTIGVLAGVDGDNHYGSFNVAADGTWSYAMNGAHDEFAGGQDYTDSVTITTAGGDQQQITVTIHGTNDAATFSGDTAAELTETDAAQGTGGTLIVADVDSSNAVVERTSVAGTYGAFSIAADGTWTYVMDGAHDELVGERDYTDSFTIVTADDTPQTITVTLHGSNDAAVFGVDGFVGDVSEDGVLTAGGTVTVSDADEGEGSFSGPGSPLGTDHGTFTFANHGSSADWTYTLDNSTVQSLNTGDVVYDNLTVESLDGTAGQISIAIHGVDEAAGANPVTKFIVNQGRTEINGIQYLFGFDSNDVLQVSNNYVMTTGPHAATYGGVSSTAMTFTETGGREHAVEVVLVGYTDAFHTDTQIV